MKKMEPQTGKTRNSTTQAAGEGGFMLLGLIVAIALILIALSVAASSVAFSLRREREEESVRRANQYVLAIRRYYKKFGRYPGSMQQLENTNNVRYLRKQYVDPLTGKADWRLFGVGQNKTTVKGFFGEPLAGIANAGLGAAAGMQSTGFGATSGASGSSATAGASAASGASTASGIAGASSASVISGAGGAAGSASTDSSGTSGTGGASTLGSAAGMQSSMGSGTPGSSGPFMGVGSAANGNSIIDPNEQATYEDWEFLYDPRLEKLKATAALNAGASSMGAGTLGQTPGAFGSSTANPVGSTGTPGSTTPNGGAAPASATPTGP
jgi:type II secretory pathway pseudopilin PulG